MPQRSALWPRYLLFVLMAVPALGASGCNCSGRNGHSDDGQGAPPPPTPGTLQFSVTNFDVSAHISTATVTVSRAGGSLGAVSVSYATSDGTATSASGDYTPASGTLSWADTDATPKTFTVMLGVDATAEPNETINLTLSAPTGGATAGPPATMTLHEAFLKFATNPIISPQPSTFNELGAYSPNVIRRGVGDYFMLYNGYNGIDQYGTTTSADGVTWPNGNSVFTVGAAGKFDDTEIWDPCVVYDPTLTPPYHMWYSGRNASGRFSIGYATSPDGNNWTRQNNGDAVLVPTPGGWDQGDVYFCHVIRDGSLWKMWYTGFGIPPSSGLSESIGYAESSNGITWTKMGPTVSGFTPGPVFQGSGVAGFDSTTVFAPCVIKDGSTYRMWYTAWNGDTVNVPFEIGYAFSANGQSWTRYVGNPVIPRGAAGTWEELEVWFPHAIIEGNSLRLWYSGVDAAGNVSIGTASNP